MEWGKIGYEGRSGLGRVRVEEGKYRLVLKMKLVCMFVCEWMCV